MTDETNGTGEAPDRITIRFDVPRGADCHIEWTEKVTTGQLYAAAWTLDAVAREMRSRELAAEAPALAVAPKDALDLLERMGIKVPGHDH